MKEMSRSIHRTDWFEKCTGTALYLEDMKFEGMLYAKTVRSSKARAKIISLQIPELPEGYCIVDKNDLPGKNILPTFPGNCPQFAEETVNFVGEPILLVVGPEREKILELCRDIRIEYEDLPPVSGLEDAQQAGAPRLFGPNNCYVDRAFEKGDVEEAFRSAARIFERDYFTGYQEHLYMETNRIVAVYEKDRLTIYGPLQIPDAVKKMLSLAFGWPPERFRVIQTTTGGGFGGKIETPVPLAAHAAFAAYKTRRPVLLLYDRHEDMTVTTKRHPSAIRIRTALDAEDRVTGIDMDIMLKAGAYEWFCRVVLDCGMKMATGPYDFPNVRVRGRAFATNSVMPGACRGFGVVQATFAVETHMAALARELGLDPLDFKAKHLLKKNDRTCTGGLVRHEVKMPEIIRSVTERSGYREKCRRYERERGPMRRGIGIALYLFGAPHSMGSRKAPRKIALVKHENGVVEIRTTIVEIGQGIQTTFKKIVSQVLGIPVGRIVYENPDTDRDPDTLGTGASLGIVLFGKSVERAAKRLKTQWNESETVEVIEDFVEPAYVQWDEVAMRGDAFHAYSWGAVVVEVAVDRITFQFEVTGLWTAHDVGKAIDERMVQGQVEGGIVQGLGFASMEKMETREGRILQANLTDYMIPTSKDVPPIESVLVDNPYEEGPFGAKSVGEMPVIGVAPALAAAIQQACGVEITRVPITPEVLMKAWEEKAGRP